MDSPTNPQKLRLAYELGNAFASRLELQDLIPFVAERCRLALDADGVSVMLADRERAEFYFPYLSQADPTISERLAGLSMPIESGIAGEVLRRELPMKVDDPGSDARFYSVIDRHTRTTTRCLIAAPLIGSSGPIGVVEAVNTRSGKLFSDDDLELLAALAHNIAIAIENARRFEAARETEQRLRVEVGALKSELAQHRPFNEIVGATSGMADVLRLVENAAASDINVLIEGETGTGKELVARAIHRASSRGDGPFLAVNCAALAEQLLESTLFGHRRGSFTGATRDQPGIFRSAEGGVVFLDEIGELPLAMQSKLLRVLQEREVLAVGDTRPQKVDVRVLSASNREMRSAMNEGQFRADLYYRLAVFPISLPPLRERHKDIPLLAEHFVTAASRRGNKRIAGIEPAAMNVLVRHRWPGNIRELQNEIERAVAMAREGESVGLPHLSEHLRSVAVRSPAPHTHSLPETTAVEDAGSLDKARDTFEANFIRSLLKQHAGNVSRTAEALGISRVALQRKMKRYHLR